MPLVPNRALVALVRKRRVNRWVISGWTLLVLPPKRVAYAMRLGAIQFATLGKKATCTEPKTCAICGTTKGIALGHNFYQLNWVTSQRPTCQTEGLESNTCQRCNETKTNPIPVVSCVAGEWQTVEEESTSTCIIKAQYCYMCGKEIDRKQLILSSSSDNYDTDSSTNNGKSNFNTYNNTAQQETSASYVLNKSTKKFHHPYCDSVKKIAPKNYKTSSESRSTLIKLGYSPCGKCSP